MITVVLAKVKRSPETRAADPTGLSKVQTPQGCACEPLTKAKRSKRKKKIGSKQYLAWLDSKTPSFGKKVRKFLKAESARIARHLWAELEQQQKLRKALTQAQIDELLKSIDFSNWTQLAGILDENLLAAFKANARAGFEAIGFSPSEDIVDLVNEQAVEWAAKRSAELVGMKRNEDGEFVENPNKKWAITESTREELRGLVEDAVDEGWSADTFAAEIGDSFGFSEARSMTIARTELAFAHVEGNLTAWVDSDMVAGKESILGSEHDMDDVCNDNAEQGVIAIYDEFISGHAGPPYHPNCVCDVVPVLKEDE